MSERSWRFPLRHSQQKSPALPCLPLQQIVTVDLLASVRVEKAAWMQPVYLGGSEHGRFSTMADDPRLVFVTKYMLRICTVLLASATLLLLYASEGDIRYISTVDGEDEHHHRALDDARSLYLFTVVGAVFGFEVLMIIVDFCNLRTTCFVSFCCFCLEQVLAYLMTSASTAQRSSLTRDVYKPQSNLIRHSVCHNHPSSLLRAWDKYCHLEKAAYATAVCCVVALIFLALLSAEKAYAFIQEPPAPRHVTRRSSTLDPWPGPGYSGHYT